MESFLSEFESLEPVETSEKRRICNKCSRPLKVCWCSYLPKETLETRCTLVVLQHPSEEKQCLKTAPILMAGISPGKCHIIKGKKFTPSRKCWDVQGNDTILMYPGPNAINLQDLPNVAANGRPYTIVLIDGTWPQAKSMYHNSPCLHQIQQIKISPSKRSEYVIKTQPTEGCLSTVESGATALSFLEDNPSITQILLRPLHALCNFQLQHGAVVHHSKDLKNQTSKKDNQHKDESLTQEVNSRSFNHCLIQDMGRS